MWDAPIDQTGISDWPVSVRYIRSAPQQEASPNRKKPKCAYLCILNLSLSGQCESLYYDLPSFTAMTDRDVTLVDDRMCCNLFHCFLFVFLYFCFIVARGYELRIYLENGDLHYVFTIHKKESLIHQHTLFSNRLFKYLNTLFLSVIS